VTFDTPPIHATTKNNAEAEPILINKLPSQNATVIGKHNSFQTTAAGLCSVGHPSIRQAVALQRRRGSVRRSQDQNGMSKDRKLHTGRPSQPLTADLSVTRPGVDVSKYLTTEFRAAVERLARADYVFATKPERQTQQKRIRDLLPIAFPPDGRPPSNWSQVNSSRTAACV
jgi:hypothetical protein